VRQLENCLRRAVLIARGDVLLPEHIALEDHRGAPAESSSADTDFAGLKQRVQALVEEILPLAEPEAHANVLDLVEEALIARALARCRNNQVHAARMLGISRNTLRHRIKKYGLDAAGE
jgi:DNA-binding NtrC family response regulator